MKKSKSKMKKSKSKSKMKKSNNHTLKRKMSSTISKINQSIHKKYKAYNSNNHSTVPMEISPNIVDDTVPMEISSK